MDVPMTNAPTTQQKAWPLTWTPSPTGGFAEIGGGQEVARWFFSVGSAATGVAKTISAYDMAVSDGLYGPTQRYVSRQRLEAMLEHEFAQLVQQLGPRRGDATAFFTFADTVATRGHARAENGRGCSRPTSSIANPSWWERGSFRPATKLTLDLLERARQLFVKEPGVDGQAPVVLAEMTLRSLSEGSDVGHADFLARADILAALGTGPSGSPSGSPAWGRSPTSAITPTCPAAYSSRRDASSSGR